MSNDLDSLHLSILTKYGFPRRRLLLSNLKVGDFNLMHTNIKSEMRSFKSNENIRKKEGGSYYVVSTNKASSVTL